MSKDSEYDESGMNEKLSWCVQILQYLAAGTRN